MDARKLLLASFALPLMLLTVRTEPARCGFDACGFEWSHGLVVPVWVLEIRDQPPDVAEFGGYRVRKFQAGIYTRWEIIPPLAAALLGFGGPLLAAFAAYLQARQRNKRLLRT
jgi:hypothetical protein